MFTGLVTDVGEVRSVKPRAENLHRITIFCRYPRTDIAQGASIACSGVCMTVVDSGEEEENGRVSPGVEVSSTYHPRPTRLQRHGARHHW